MTTAPLLPHSVAVRAAEAHLGEFVGPLTPRRGSSLRTALVGGLVMGFAGFLWSHEQPVGTWADIALIVLGLAGLVTLAVGLIELAPTPGRVYLFEDGFLHVLGSEVEVVPYAAAKDGERLRIRSRTLLNQRVA